MRDEYLDIACYFESMTFPLKVGYFHQACVHVVFLQPRHELTKVLFSLVGLHHKC